MKFLHILSACLVCSLAQKLQLPGLQAGCSPTSCMVVLCMSALGCEGRVDPHGGYCGCCPLCIKQLSCSPNICFLVDCMYPTACDGRIDPHGGYCGCCPMCIKQLAAGQACDVSLFAGTVGTHAECGKGLHCDKTSNTCVSTKRAAGPCELELQKSNSQHLLGAPKPSCETDGTYAAKQCKGAGCYCADADGNDLGYFTNYGAGTAQMDCKCARDKAAYMKTGLIGKFFFCDDKGNYQKVQCLGSVCYCTDSDGKALTNTVGVPIENRDQLDC